MTETHKQWLDRHIELNDGNSVVFDGFDDCIIGITENPEFNVKFVYDFDKVIARLMSNGMGRDEAVDYFGFNFSIAGSTPIFISLAPPL